MSAARILIVYLGGALATVATIVGVAAGLSYLTHQSFFGVDASRLAAQLLGLVVSAIVGLLLLLFADKQLCKRWFLFLAMNVVVVASISFLVHIFHAEDYMTRSGLDYSRLALFCIVWGMSGSIISLLLSRWQAKWLLGVKVLVQRDPQHELSNNEEWLLVTVKTLSEKAGLPATPEVGIWTDEAFNAFATGPSKSRSLVAVSSALLDKMPTAQVEAVLGHEIAHIANGDMVTMTLLQGTMNSFVMFGSRVIGFIVQKAADTDSEWPYYVSQALFEWILMILGAIMMCWFSRKREFAADRGGAELTGKQKMIAALATLQREMDRIEKQQKIKPSEKNKAEEERKKEQKRNPEPIAALMISSTASRFLDLFNTHPPLKVRIERLEQLANQD
ncbi:MAG: protease HtpX [Candidatus Obscuribacterales bacterium]|nr:protease HtpX [Candidatus Obscuribacterales bacterium]